MAENLNFNYLTSNQSYPDGIDSGNIYFKLVEDNTNNQIYNQSHSIEIALDLGTQRYFLTPKIATTEINGLLSKNDKEKIDDFANNYVNRENFKNENNVNISLNDSGSEPTGSLIFDENNQLQLNISIPRQLIKGEDGQKGTDGTNGDDGIDGADGDTPTIKEEVLIETSGTNNPTARMNKTDPDGNEYQLAIQFPDLKGEKGATGNTPSFKNLSVTLDGNIDVCQGNINRVSDSDEYDIEIKLPKNQLIGPRGWQGAKGNDATANIEINTSDIPFNSIDNIEVSPGIEAGSTALTLSGHYSPVIPKNNDVNPPIPNSLLIKGANNDYNYVLLAPAIGFLEYDNGWTFNSTIPVKKGGTGQTSLTSNRILLGNGTNAIEEIANENGALYYDNSDNQHPAPRFGTLPVTLGGTGKNSFTNNNIIAGSTNGIKEISNAAGAFYSEGTEETPQFGTLPISLGGTGLTSIPSNSILTGNSNGQIGSISLSNGALFKDDNGAQFGTLPVSLGGTGATTALEARRELGATRTVLVFNKYWAEEDEEITDDTLEDYCLKIWNAVEFEDDSLDPDNPEDDNLDSDSPENP